MTIPAPDRGDDELSQLVREANDSGASFQDLAGRAIDPLTGTRVSKPYLHKLAANNVAAAPTPERLRAIAAALRKPLVLVQRAAAAQYLDYRATELSGYSEDVRLVIAHLAGMNRTELKRWQAMMEADERVRGENAGTHDAP